MKADVDGLIPGGVPADPEKEKKNKSGDTGKDSTTEVDGGAIYKTELNVQGICEMIEACGIKVRPHNCYKYRQSLLTHEKSQRRPHLHCFASRSPLMPAATCANTYSVRRCAALQTQHGECFFCMYPLKMSHTALRLEWNCLRSSLLRSSRKGRDYENRRKGNCEGWLAKGLIRGSDPVYGKRINRLLTCTYM